MTKIEKARAYGKAYYAANREKLRVQKQAWKKANPRKVAASQRKMYYGISEEEFERLLFSSGGVCPICKGPFPKIPDVDHCHKIGKVRGLLCRSCNLAIGFLKDDFSAAIRAASYLRKNL